MKYIKHMGVGSFPEGLGPRRGLWVGEPVLILTPQARGRTTIDSILLQSLSVSHGTLQSPAGRAPETREQNPEQADSFA